MVSVMSGGQDIVAWYVIALNVLTFLAYGWDKYCAVHHRWRVSEVVLLGLAVIGGSIGAIMAMRVFRHKTLHWKFRIGLPLCLMIHCLGLIWLHVQ